MSMFSRKADDGSFKPFELIPEGVTDLVVTEATALPQVNPHILSLTFEDSKGRSMKAKWDQDKKDSKGRLTQRYFMNLMIDALLGDQAISFSPNDLVGKFCKVEIKHNVVPMPKREKDEDGTWVDVLDESGKQILEDRTFANLGRIIGGGTPFERTAPANPLDADLEGMF